MVDVNHLIDLGDFQSCFIPIKGLIVGYFAKNGRTFTMKSRFFFRGATCLFFSCFCDVKSNQDDEDKDKDDCNDNNNNSNNDNDNDNNKQKGKGWVCLMSTWSNHEEYDAIAQGIWGTA